MPTPACSARSRNTRTRGDGRLGGRALVPAVRSEISATVRLDTAGSRGLCAPPGGRLSPLKMPPGTALLFDTALKSDFLLLGGNEARAANRDPRDSRHAAGRFESAPADEQARVAQVLDHLLPISSRRLGLENELRAVFPPCRATSSSGSDAQTLVMNTADNCSVLSIPPSTPPGHIPRARFVSYPSGGHLWVGHQKEVVSEIISFLQ